MIDPRFWRGRRVFLTGHTGFKGGWLALWLQRLGAEVTGYRAAAADTAPSLFEAADVAGEHRPPTSAISAISARLHASAAGGRAGDRHPPGGAVAGAAVLRGSGRHLRDQRDGHRATCSRPSAHCRSVRAVVVVTSDKCYENRGLGLGLPRERPARRPRSLQQQQGLRRARDRRLSRQSSSAPAARARVATARAGNVIGGGDWARDRLVPDAMRAFGCRPACCESATRTPVRPWQHVLDPLVGVSALAEHLVRERAPIRRGVELRARGRRAKLPVSGQSYRGLRASGEYRRVGRSKPPIDHGTKPPISSSIVFSVFWGLPPYHDIWI